MYASSSLAFAALALEDGGELGLSFSRMDVLTFQPAVSPEALREARTLREALVRCLGAAIGGEAFTARDVETLNSFAADEPPLVKLTAEGGLVRVATDPVRCGLAAIARDGIELLARRANDLRRCAGCDTVFLDESRGRRRRWCAMERCGNRAKVAGYRARRQR